MLWSVVTDEEGLEKVKRIVIPRRIAETDTPAQTREWRFITAHPVP